MQEKLVHCIQCQGHSEGVYNQTVTISIIFSKVLVSLQPNGVSVEKWDHCIQGQGHSRLRFEMLVNVCLDDIFWTTKHFVIKPGILMHHYKPDCLAEKLVHFVQCQGHRKVLYNQIITISVVSSKLLVSLQPNLVQ